jgi:Exostosin family
MKVLLASCGKGPGAWTDKAVRLKYLHSVATERKHHIVQNPEEADIILISNLGTDNWYSPVVKHPLLLRYPHKCFGIHDGDNPLPLLRGLYTAARASKWYFGRVRGGSYALFQERFKNRYLASVAASDRREKKYLLSFLGRNNHPVRNALFGIRFARGDVVVKEVAFDIFKPSDQECREMHERLFCNTLLESKFAVCPRGVAPSSIRLFEALQLGVAPIVIADEWRVPAGPDWSDFSIRIPERHVGEIERVALERESEAETMGGIARKAFNDYFCDEKYFNYAVNSIMRIKGEQWFPERLAQIFGRVHMSSLRAKTAVGSFLRHAIGSPSGKVDGIT